MNKILFLIFFLLGSCAHSVHQVHMSDFNPYQKLESGKWITSESSQGTFLGFVTQTDYVNEARAKLIGQCPNGAIQGITTRYSTSLGFFSWRNKILMQGLCVKGKS